MKIDDDFDLWVGIYQSTYTRRFGTIEFLLKKDFINHPFYKSTAYLNFENNRIELNIEVVMNVEKTYLILTSYENRYIESSNFMFPLFNEEERNGTYFLNFGRKIDYGNVFFSKSESRHINTKSKSSSCLLI